ncbi:cytochrome c biogenesis protein ResB [Geomesophilobacter sediminis]|uniref:Cytochrome c biogenesis protein ResB n=1 Tax=Geomesophilobacter sediminis TaxID=2798584 RepID=A0A8J7JM69_9BACT|nr:cytochrome c biogenesis protein ResB [Geomesophilobacter sediminis]MBJ6725715.1 cytochrome c biogenesis protein ResB [Geomesophilobacter sediminis]
MRPVKFLTARTTVIALFLAITAALLIAIFIPQRGDDGKIPAWVTSLPEPLGFLGQLGLDHVVTTPWFAALVLVFAVSLLFSTIEQFGAVRALTRREPGTDGEWREVADGPGLPARLAEAGYNEFPTSGPVQRYVKHGLGYWGGFLLHLGLVIAVLFSLVYVVTQHRVLVRLVGDEVTRLTPDNVAVKQGLFPVQPRLPESVTLTRVEPRFYGNDKLQSLSSELYFTERPGDLPQRVAVGLSDKSSFGRFLVYQGNPYGLAFNLDIALPGDYRKMQLMIHYPASRKSPGYAELPVPGTDLIVKGKFVPDREKGTMEARAPLLTLRLIKGKRFLGEAEINPGERKEFGPVSVKLTSVQWWGEILLDGSRGTAGIFAGFAIILVGVLSSYCLIPREVLVREERDRTLVRFFVRRFAPLYREEFEALAGDGRKKEA